jgi:hypothetical protein
MMRFDVAVLVEEPKIASSTWCRCDLFDATLLHRPTLNIAESLIELEPTAALEKLGKCL